MKGYSVRGLCEFLVAGKRALPIRAIPFATAWDLTPDDIACAIAQPPAWDGRRFMTVLRAQYRDATGVPRQLARGESLEWARNIDRLAKSGADHIDQIQALPAGLFVWEDNLSGLIGEANDVFTADPPYGPGFSAIELNCYPLMTEPDETLVLEGFDLAVNIAAMKLTTLDASLEVVRNASGLVFGERGTSARADTGEIPSRTIVERKLTRDQQNRLICHQHAKRYWKVDGDMSHTAILQMPEIARFVGMYKDRKTVRGWISDVDPRPPGTRRGRPKRR